MPTGADPDEDHYDTNVVMGLNLPRLVQATKFTRDKGLAGRDIQDIRLAELTWDGLNSWGFRLLANGRYISVEHCRSFKESVFVNTLLTNMRKKRPDGTILDIDLLAHKLAMDKNLKFETDPEKHAVYKDCLLYTSPSPRDS